MKKKLIAGASAVALAAMPVVGVFAVDATVTDYVQLNVSGSCTMSATPISDGGEGESEPNELQDYIPLGTISAGGATSPVNGTPMTISCNTADGINLTAVPTSLSDSGKPAINFGAFAASTSVWSAKVGVTGADSGNVTISNGWDDFTAKTAGTIITSTAERAVYNLVVTPQYKASAANNQPAGTYNGSITYTFVATS